MKVFNRIDNLFADHVGISGKALAALFTFVLIYSSSCAAQIIDSRTIYEEEVKKSRNFTALDENLFGENVSLQDGSASFTQDDIVLKTNGTLPLKLGRRSSAKGPFGFGKGWALDIPFMKGSYDSRYGWVNLAGTTQRCSSGSVEPKSYPGVETTGIIGTWNYWHGISVNIPEKGSEQLLKPDPATIFPSDGKSYFGSTKKGWRVSCIPLSGGVGEGFLVSLPDGTKYYFDWMIPFAGRKLYGEINGFDRLLVNVSEIYIYATKVVDRYGFTINYNYSSLNKAQLSSITSMDGQRIDITYSGAQISEAKSSSKKWSYAYNPDHNGAPVLSSITLPDLSKWVFSGNDLSLVDEDDYGNSMFMFWRANCSTPYHGANDPMPAGLPGENVRAVRMTHPSGAVGDFTFYDNVQGINNAPGYCVLNGGQKPYTVNVPAAYKVTSLKQKSISGLGLIPVTWNFSYKPSWSFEDRCTQAVCESSSTTIVSRPGLVKRYVYGNSFKLNYGRLLSETWGPSENQVAKSKAITYLASAAGQPFPDRAGIIPGTGGGVLYGNMYTMQNRPPVKVINTQAATSFTRSVSSFDIFARPLQTISSSSLGYTATEKKAYLNNYTKWAIDEVTQQVRDNIVVQDVG